jgi:hypothetical protein
MALPQITGLSTVVMLRCLLDAISSQPHKCSNHEGQIDARFLGPLDSRLEA